MSHFVLNPGLAWEFKDQGSIGGDLSASFWIDGAAYVGVDMDGVYDVERRAKRLAVGPMAGISFWGLSPAYTVEVKDAETRHGVSGTIFFSTGYFSLFVRKIWFPGDDTIIGGVNVKFPFAVWKRRDGFGLSRLEPTHAMGIY